MSVPLSYDMSYLEPDVTLDEVLSWQPSVLRCHDQLHQGTGPGSDYLGWMDPLAMLPQAERNRITAVVTRLREESDVLVVIGIGGSYLGARAVVEAIGGPEKDCVLFAGQNISADHHKELMGKLAGKRFAINVISKSGTTTESSIAFRLLRELLEGQVGKEKASRLIVATTDAGKGALRKLSEQEGYDTFVVPDDVGGRYSVLSAVGLLPIAYAGIDIGQMLDSASECAKACSNPDLMSNPAYVYAVIRNILYSKGKAVEIMASFEPRLHYLAEWWKQLFGESEGKDGVSLFPASVDLTSDLHSMGQWIQQGRRIIFETFLDIERGAPDLQVPGDPENLDGLNFLSGSRLHDINRIAYQATALAHREGDVPNSTIRLEAMNAQCLGALLFFFEKACAMSGYLLGVNPFDQPGVEAYKNHMFALLDKPSFEEAGRELKKRLSEKRETISSFGDQV
jgi:glucose-6-phosphate isomerase